MSAFVKNSHRAPAEIENFARYEFKYLLNVRQRDDIENEIRHFMTYDGHVHAELDNRYIVRSLYFDNPSASHYYEKIDGIKTRHKFRLRTYAKSYEEGVPLYLEKKGRHNQRTYKQRIAIPPDDLELVMTADRHDDLYRRFKGVELVEQFLFETIRRNVRPMVLVDYQRRPYTSDFDTEFRLTFDSILTAMATDELFPPATTTKFSCLEGKTILEVKFQRRIPAWFHRIIQAHEMTRLSISKFCVGMETCGLATNLE